MCIDPAREPVVNERGERLVRFRAAGHPADATFTRTAVDFSLVLATHGSHVLLVRNRRRSVWELPGGFLDTGELAAQCAARELAEETGQTGTNLRLHALFELEIVDRGSATGTAIRRGALYRAGIPVPVPFVPTPEIAAIGFWPPTALPAGTSAIDASLVAQFA